MSMSEAPRGRRRWCQVPCTVAMGVAVGLMLLTAACGGSQAALSPSASTTSPGVTSRLAYVHCVRAHGVQNYPDPGSDGEEPPGTKELFVNNPQYRAASDVCRHLLPNGGRPTEAPQADAMTEAGALKLAGCMRAHGYPSFPDPTIDSVGQPVFKVQGAGLDPHAPQIVATARRCLSLLHLTGLPQATS
jgi:hypothetical protein